MFSKRTTIVPSNDSSDKQKWSLPSEPNGYDKTTYNDNANSRGRMERTVIHNERYTWKHARSPITGELAVTHKFSFTMISK